MNYRTHALSVILGVLAVASTVAAEPTADDHAAAYELNEAGFTAFEEQRFEEAARAFASAWQLSRDEALRKNEALAWFRAGRCDEAVIAANKFLLTDNISDSDRTDINSVLANCKVDFAKRAIAAAHLGLAEDLLDEANLLATDDYTRDRIVGTRVDLAAARDAAALPVEPEVRTVYLAERPPILEISLIASGGAVIAGALAYHLVALGWQRDFFAMERGERPPNQEEFDSLRKRVHVARWLVPTLYAVGAGTAVAGASLLFFVEPSRAGEATAGLTLRAEF